MFVLDSLGMLSTEKEITDALNDKQVRDMTKSQLIKGAFRMLTLKLGQANIPMIVTNHTYDVIGAYIPTKEMGGGSGLKYAASTIIHLSKKKEKDGTEIVGNLIKAKTAKSRLSKENQDVTVRLYYDERGLDRYYGLLELGESAGMWKNVAGRYEMTVDGETKKVYAKAILKDPETYFTEEVMQQLDAAAKQIFSYGTN
jgi:RecA/RadA recombinase